MRHLSDTTNARRIGIISIILVTALALGLFFYIQVLTRDNIQKSLFIQQQERQIEATKSISNHIGSDLNSVLSMLDGLANSYYFQKGDLYSSSAKSLMQVKYGQLNPTINRLFVLNENNVVTISLAPQNSENFLSADFSLRDWVIETRATRQPVFSDGFERQGTYRIFISYPIINRDTQEFIGIVATSIPTVPFFSHYANVEDINSQFLVVFNKQGRMLANGAGSDFVGKYFSDDDVLEFINHNQILIDLTTNLLDGQAGHAVYDYGRGERLTTQSPVLVQDKPTYFIQLVTHTAMIYSDFDNALVVEGTKSFLLFGSTISAIAVLAVFLIKWNSLLNAEVKSRTNELEKVNERLKLNVKMQQEFLDIAAHELRTPIQPIIGLSQVLYENSNLKNTDPNSSNISDQHEHNLLEAILRNAQRLERLAEDLLDVTRLEGQSMRLNKVKFDLTEVMLGTINDFSNSIGDQKKIEITSLPSEPVFVNADKGRVIQVISNLLLNAIKFTYEGTIGVGVEKVGSEVIVTIRDSGVGIDTEILPRLFTKFVSRSEKGTGLGLFISKGILDLHGGRIWAENNKDGIGATFRFSLPTVV